MSTPIDDGGPAFAGFSHTEGRGPCRRGPTGEWEEYAPGMSLRDWFAGQAITGLLAQKWAECSTDAFVADASFALADAMLAARKKEAQP